MVVADKRGVEFDECDKIKHNALLIRIDDELADKIIKFAMPLYIKAHPELKNHTFSWNDRIAILYEYYVAPPKSVLQQINDTLERDAV